MPETENWELSEDAIRDELDKISPDATYGNGLRAVSIATVRHLISKGWIAPDKYQDLIKQGRKEIIELFATRWRGCETNSFTGDSRMLFLLSADQWQALLKELE